MENASDITVRPKGNYGNRISTKTEALGALNLWLRVGSC